MQHIVLTGAGSLQFGLGTLGDIFSTKSLYGSTITLLDINEDALNHVYQHTKDFLSKNDPSHSWGFTIKATTDRQEALKDADFVIISIEVGDRFALWDIDRTIPQQYGIRQVYGENGGPGGLFHSLRIIPPVLEICGDVQKICPDAVVFNYSNPMSRICTTVHRVFPQLRFVGLCHEIASLERYLPSMLEKKFEDIDILAAGLNHFSVLLTAKDKKTGADLYPEIRTKAKEFFRTVPSYGDYCKHLETHGNFIETEGVTEIANISAERDWAERGVFNFILENFDLLPITTDSHFGEYLSWGYDISDHRGILDFYSYYRKYLGQMEHRIELKVKERVAVIMDGMAGGKPYIEAAVNIPNKGYIAELPEWIAVEVPAQIDKNSIEGIQVPTLPRGFAGLLCNQIAIHDMTAEAVITKSKHAVVQALLVDPVVDTCVNVKDMVEVMISQQKEYLGYLV